MELQKMAFENFVQLRNSGLFKHFNDEHLLNKKL